MDLQVSSISNRMSLRPPLAESLELLHQVCGVLQLDKTQPVTEALAAIQQRFPQVREFERDFPSLCFNIATGVGKTRLMGAFITYLYKTRGIRHFFILAPNLTIYNKLIGDFSPGPEKYVLKGLAEFATNPPEVITGDNYESGRGIRDEAASQKRLDQGTETVHINIFNISKINSEVRGGKEPRIKRLSEYIGQSYFDYLAGLDDLVLLMDESHRYRGSAGLRAINELRPVLGLELTATAQTMNGSKVTPFRNVLFRYPLALAMKDGFVKEPAVATRRDLDVAKLDPAAIEKMKLEDGLLLHENAKLKLDAFAAETGRHRVKPFALVVARDIEHAKELHALLDSQGFHGGTYQGKVITVHTGQAASEEDENLAKLLSVERSDNPVEVVIHVSKLGEGWDVNNLYTIIPLRAADSKTLVEQSIGRGLRLPYGSRTGNPDVDRLTIVAHDRFQEVIDYAKREDSILRQVFIGEDVPNVAQVKVVAEPVLLRVLRGEGPATGGITFVDKEERELAPTVNDVIESVSTELALAAPLPEVEFQARILVAAAKALPPGTKPERVAAMVDKVRKAREERTIEVPHVMLRPKGDVSVRFEDFDLDISGTSPRPVEQEVLVRHLESDAEFVLRFRAIGPSEDRLENYLVFGLMDCDDIDYGRESALLYKLSGQLVAHLRTYLKDDEEIRNVLQYHRRSLIDEIHSQMQRHMVQKVEEWEVQIGEPRAVLNLRLFARDAKEPPRDFRQPVDDKRAITRYVFTGFSKCLFDMVKFQSDPERRFSIILDRDGEKWFKPSQAEFPIYYRDGTYVPDFVVETKDAKLVCEVKAAKEVKDPQVLAKADAIQLWCQHATDDERARGGKPWSYLLVPDDAIRENMTLEGLASKYTYAASPAKVGSEEFPRHSAIRGG